MTIIQSIALAAGAGVYGWFGVKFLELRKETLAEEKCQLAAQAGEYGEELNHIILTTYLTPPGQHKKVATRRGIGAVISFCAAAAMAAGSAYSLATQDSSDQPTHPSVSAEAPPLPVATAAPAPGKAPSRTP